MGKNDIRHIYIIGSKGIPAKYGGFETFVDRLTMYKESDRIQYHVACMGDGAGFRYHGAECFSLKVPKIGPAKAIWYDVKAFQYCLKDIKRNAYEAPIVYVLACRIGPFMKNFQKQIHNLGGMVIVNPDGHEWMREKWSKPVRAYWKWSEKNMIRYSDLAICDSLNIEVYINREYEQYRPRTTFIPYGADHTPKEHSQETIDEFHQWLEKYNLVSGEYYLIVGRFVPENNYVTMLREFHLAETNKKLAIITNPDNRKLLRKINKNKKVLEDERIIFVGTVYDKELLTLIRENAFCYLHGHEVGGTNPSLLEALAATKRNLLLDVSFNREVAADGALYFNKELGSMCQEIGRLEAMSEEETKIMTEKARNRIETRYQWKDICRKYEDTFQLG